MFSEKEQRIIKLVGKNLTNDEIAEEMCYSTKWIQKMLTKIYLKSGMTRESIITQYKSMNS